MSHLPLLTGIQNPELRKIAEPVENITEDILALEKEMQTIMKEERGVGLAAPQIGILKRVILVTLGKKEIFMINPVITSFSAETNLDDEEGCLSVPGKFGNVSRATYITLEFLDKNGKKQKKNLDHFDARVVQHEIDHLNGVLFVDRLVNKKVSIF